MSVWDLLGATSTIDNAETQDTVLLLSIPSTAVFNHLHHHTVSMASFSGHHDENRNTPPKASCLTVVQKVSYL